MGKITKLLALAGASLVAAAVVVSCATIIKGSNHTLSVNSSPPSAAVVITRAAVIGEGMRIFEGTTPATVKLSRKEEYVVSISMRGYREVKVPVVHAGVEEWFFANIVCGGLIGLVVDYADGAMYKMAPETINVTLQTASLPSQPAGELYAVLRLADENGAVRAIATPMIRDTRAN